MRKNYQTMKQREKEEYEYSIFFQFLNEYFRELKYKKIDKEVILDFSLSKRDLSIYLAIVHESSFSRDWREISHHSIMNLTGVSQPNQSVAIKRLLEKNYLEVREGNKYNQYKIKRNPKKYFRLGLEQFEGLKNYKLFTRRLRTLVLSNGNENIPSLKRCKEICNKITYKERRAIELLYHNYDFKQEIDKWHFLQLKETRDYIESDLIDPIQLEELEKELGLK